MSTDLPTGTPVVEGPNSNRCWRIGDRDFDLGQRAMVMGILNVTPDSFSDGGRYLGRDAAVARAVEMVVEGAGIVDVGGESTRPGASAVAEGEELERTVPVIARLRRECDVLISIDTSKAVVAQAALEAGADIVNDVTGLSGDPAMVGLVAGARCGVVVMHMKGGPRTMQHDPRYGDVVEEVGAYLCERCDFAAAHGVERSRVVVDPGIGFGKTPTHNLALLGALRVLARRTGRPVLVGASRKSFLGKVLGTGEVADRKWPTVALSALAREMGAGVLRVHDVAENAQAVRMAEAVLAAD